MQAYVPDCLKAEEWIRLQTCSVRRDDWKRFRRRVGTTDWEGAFDRLERFANPLCWGVIGLSILFFLPLFLRILGT